MEETKNLFSRNVGYVNQSTQEKLANLKVLIAGCGVGSQVAVAAARMGIKKFVLIDGDEVSASNLNRQAYSFSQIGKNKAASLGENILAINPECEINVYDRHFDESVLQVFEGVDLVIDTIDFLDLKAIVILHEVAEMKKVPLISGMTIGWGACCMYFPNQKNLRGQFRKIFNVTEGENKNQLSYVEKFKDLFYALSNHIDPQVVKVMDQTFQSMLDGKPCPAPQVVSGTLSLASLMTTAIHKILNSEPVPESPELIIHDMVRLVTTSVLNLERELRR